MDLAVANSEILYLEDRKKLGDASNDILQFHAFKLEIADSLLTDKHINDENSALSLRLTETNNPQSYTQPPKSTPTSSITI